ncbi:MAG: hypothetical protein ACKVHP_25630, partial [Verrucomicrobiales bacterium]
MLLGDVAISRRMVRVMVLKTGFFLALFAWCLAATPVKAQEAPQPFRGNCCACNGNIKFRAGTKPDLIRIGTRVQPTSAMNPFDDGFRFSLSNDSATLFSQSLAAYTLTESANGRRWTYKDPTAPANGGIHTVTIQKASGLSGGFLIYVRAYTDMQAASEAKMTSSFVIGNDSFFNQSD